MINVRTIKKLADGDGLTLKNGKIKRYKSGYQVATNGVEVISPEMAIQAVREFKGNCGVWLENGRYYIDISKRVSTKREAVEIGKKCNQLSIYRWRGNPACICSYNGILTFTFSSISQELVIPIPGMNIYSFSLIHYHFNQMNCLAGAWRN